MSRESLLTVGALLVLMPAVGPGGASILLLLVGDLAYAQNDLEGDEAGFVIRVVGLDHTPKEVR